MAQSQGWPAQVLKRMPEDDGGPGTAHIFDFGVANVGSGCVRLQTDSLAAVAHEGLRQSSIAGPHIEDGARRQYPLQPGGKRTARAPKHNVSKPRESNGRRSIPGVIGLGQLCVAWPRRSRRHVAPGAQYPAVTPIVSAVEPVTTQAHSMAGGARVREYAKELLSLLGFALLSRPPSVRNALDLVFDNGPSS